LFLANNLRPDLPFLEILANAWPYILICWGLLRLIEVLVWYMQSKPLPRAGVSGGEWTVIILLTLIGSGVYYANQHRGYWSRHIRIGGIEMFGETYDYGIAEQKVPAGKATRLVIENLRGNVRVTGGDAQEVKISGRKTLRSLTRAEADQGHTQTPVEVAAQGDRIVVRTNQERLPSDRRAATDLEITIPKSMSVLATGRYGDYDITGVLGGIELNSDNAGIRLHDIAGNVRIEHRRSDIIRIDGAKGDIELRGRGTDLELEDIEGQVTVAAEYYGDVQLRNLARPLRYEAGEKGGRFDLEFARLPGEVRMDLRSINAMNVVGPIRLNARSRDVYLNGITDTLTLQLERGDVEIRPGSQNFGKIDVRTRSGNIQFAAPDAARFSIKAIAHRGGIDNDFGGPLKLEEEGSGNARSAMLQGATGQGPSVSLETDRGSIIVRKAVAGEAPRLPARESQMSEPPKPPRPPRGPETEIQ
jgi:DUF4097 and DUF4098 domain-containing protein YvlB